MSLHVKGGHYQECAMQKKCSISGRSFHNNDAIISAMASQITSLTIVYSIVYSFMRRSKKTSKLCVSGRCVTGIHRWPVNSPHKGPVTWKMFPFDDDIMSWWRHNMETISAFTHIRAVMWTFDVFLGLLEQPVQHIIGAYIELAYVHDH